MPGAVLGMRIDCVPGNGLFSGLELIIKKCVQLERQLSEKPKVALEVFVSLMVPSTTIMMGILKGNAEQHRGCLTLTLPKEWEMELGRAGVERRKTQVHESFPGLFSYCSFHCSEIFAAAVT